MKTIVVVLLILVLCGFAGFRAGVGVNNAFSLNAVGREGGGLSVVGRNGGGAVGRN